VALPRNERIVATSPGQLPLQDTNCNRIEVSPAPDSTQLKRVSATSIDGAFGIWVMMTNFEGLFFLNLRRVSRATDCACKGFLLRVSARADRMEEFGSGAGISERAKADLVAVGKG
jgi:hypothetical protein